ncbi:UNVERIFIED_CONTAM: hypothetical protein Slati_2711500 [Sesamum latifolium]|uniref:Uncharacterized protein n=1 Tax=Sesamum latifolium TaxID=2727402 RepID=A0AAW2W0D6_9LAMI
MPMSMPMRSLAVHAKTLAFCCKKAVSCPASVGFNWEPILVEAGTSWMLISSSIGWTWVGDHTSLIFLLGEIFMASLVGRVDFHPASIAFYYFYIVFPSCVLISLTSPILSPTGNFSFMRYVEMIAWKMFSAGHSNIRLYADGISTTRKRTILVLRAGLDPKERGSKTCPSGCTTSPVKPYSDVSTGSNGISPNSICWYTL